MFVSVSSFAGKGFVTDVTDKAVIQKRISRESLKIPSLAGQGHIFISYQWTNQRILIDIRNELIKHGHKVTVYSFVLSSECAFLQ